MGTPLNGKFYYIIDKDLVIGGTNIEYLVI